MDTNSVNVLSGDVDILASLENTAPGDPHLSIWRPSDWRLWSPNVPPRLLATWAKQCKHTQQYTKLFLYYMVNIMGFKPFSGKYLHMILPLGNHVFSSPRFRRFHGWKGCCIFNLVPSSINRGGTHWSLFSTHRFKCLSLNHWLSLFDRQESWGRGGK